MEFFFCPLINICSLFTSTFSALKMHCKYKMQNVIRVSVEAVGHRAGLLGSASHRGRDEKKSGLWRQNCWTEGFIGAVMLKLLFCRVSSVGMGMLTQWVTGMSMLAQWVIGMSMLVQ